LSWFNKKAKIKKDFFKLKKKRGLFVASFRWVLGYAGVYRLWANGSDLTA